jgi:hypothetical protein
MCFGLFGVVEKRIQHTEDRYFAIILTFSARHEPATGSRNNWANYCELPTYELCKLHEDVGAIPFSRLTFYLGLLKSHVCFSLGG